MTQTRRRAVGDVVSVEMQEQEELRGVEAREPVLSPFQRIGSSRRTRPIDSSGDDDLVAVVDVEAGSDARLPAKDVGRHESAGRVAFRLERVLRICSFGLTASDVIPNAVLEWQQPGEDRRVCGERLRHVRMPARARCRQPVRRSPES